MHVGEMNLHLRDRDGLQGVVDGVGIMGPGPGVQHQAIGVRSLLDPANKLPLVVGLAEREVGVGERLVQELLYVLQGLQAVDLGAALAQRSEVHPVEDKEDRKSTRLNSSHANISYAVFCLKK